MLGSGMNLITTVIGFGMSATFIVFICTRLICGRIRAAEARPVFEMDSRTDLEQPEPRINGLEPVVIASIPTMKFNRAAFQSSEDAQCTICLGEYQEKEVLRIMPKCGHNFHLICIDVWLEKQSTCPVCRLPLNDSSEAKHAVSPRFGMVVQPVDSPQILSNHSQQWLLPAERERPQGNRITQQGFQESTLQNSDPTLVIEEAETRRQLI